jgi:hypothetical protein
MLSDKQLDANQANAQHSTGPVTTEGKQASAQNSRKHGLSSDTLYVPPDRQPEFLEMYDTYLRELQPIGEIQVEYFERLIHAKWNAIIARQLHALALSQFDDKKIASALRYISHWDRTYDKSLQALRQGQTDLALRAIPENQPIATIPASCSIAKITAEATRLARSQKRTHFSEARRDILHAIATGLRPGAAPDDFPVAPEAPPEPLDQAA